MSKQKPVSLKFSFLLALLIMVTGCASSGPAPNPEDAKKLDVNGEEASRVEDFKRQRQSNNPLDIPPDLVNDTKSEVLQSIERSKQAYASSQVVLPEVVAARIIEDDNQSYVEVDADAQVVWNQIVEYWAQQGVVLSVLEPKQGLMETQWIENLDKLEDETGPSRLIKETFGRLTGKGIEHDKYRIQLAREGDQTHVFVSHRATVREGLEEGSKKLTQFEWVQKEDNPAKVRELMQVVVLLFEGIEADTVSQ